MEIDHIDREPLPGTRDSISLWAIYLPSDRDRDEYIKNCFFTNTVTLVRGAEVKHRVPIPVSLLREITFPVDSQDIGSQVLCASLPYQDKPFVIQVYQSPSNYSTGNEKVSVIKKTFLGKNVEIVMDVNTGTLDLNVDSDEDTGGEINLNVSNNSRTAQLNVVCNGDINVNNDGNVNVISTKKISLKLDTQVEGEDINEVILTKESIKLNESDEPILLGNKTIQLISDLLDILGKDSAGPYPLLNNAQYIQLKDKLDNIKSKISFVK